MTCLVDLMRPGIGFAALRPLEVAGCEVAVPNAPTRDMPAPQGPTSREFDARRVTKKKES